MTHLILPLLLSVHPAAAAELTGTFGGTDSNSANGSEDVKLNLYEVGTASTLTQIEAYLGGGGSGEAVFVVYESSGTGYSLVYSSDPVSIPASAGAFVASPTLSVALASGGTYAMGVYFPNTTATYFWANDGSTAAGLTHAGALYGGNGSYSTLPSTLTLGAAGHAYYQRLTVDIDDTLDDDNDGYTIGDGDCNDGDAGVHPGATETCGSGDEDCDGAVDEGAAVHYYPDSDADGFGNASATGLITCDPVMSWVSNNDDCFDANSSVYPGAPELCDGLDNDCNDLVDDDCEGEPTPDTGWPTGDDTDSGDTGEDTGTGDSGMTEDSGTTGDDASEDGGGCGCQGAPAPASALALLAVLGLVRRRSA